MRSHCASGRALAQFNRRALRFPTVLLMRTSVQTFPRAFVRLATAGGFLLAAACHNVKLTPQAEAVRVIRDASQVTRCRFVDDVVSSDRLSGGLVNRDLAEENAYKILKQKTAKLGANTVLVSASTSGIQGAGLKGKAYACSGA
jgi:hypothetical protein